MWKHTESNNVRTILQFAFLVGILGSLLGTVSYAGVTIVNAGVANVQNILCSVVTTVSDILSILALMMFILGGTLYAFAHVLPATGNLRASMQGWGMGMLMGGIIALILYIIAPYLISTLLGLTTSNQGNGQNAPSPSITACQNGF
jgi:hypothetical protein